MSINVSIRLSDGTKFDVEVDGDGSVYDLKKAIEPKTTPPAAPENQKIVFKGKILKDEDLLSLAGKSKLVFSSLDRVPMLSVTKNNRFLVLEYCWAKEYFTVIYKFDFFRYYGRLCCTYGALPCATCSGSCHICPGSGSFDDCAHSCPCSYYQHSSTNNSYRWDNFFYSFFFCTTIQHYCTVQSIQSFWRRNVPRPIFCTANRPSWIRPINGIDA